MDLIRWFNIGSNMGFFTGDNAGSNDTCLQAISEALKDEYGVSRAPPSPFPLGYILIRSR
jgi:hypothetical protein